MPDFLMESRSWVTSPAALPVLVRACSCPPLLTLKDTALWDFNNPPDTFERMEGEDSSADPEKLLARVLRWPGLAPLPPPNAERSRKLDGDITLNLDCERLRPPPGDLKSRIQVSDVVIVASVFWL